LPANQRILAAWAFTALMACAAASPALAGPPYLNDDPEPTEFRHFEIYGFAQGAQGSNGWAGALGIDFNYGAAPDLQLTTVVPVEYDHSASGAAIAGLGNIELAAKLRVLHEADVGWDVAVFPRLFLPSLSDRVGEAHASLLLPIWIGRDDGQWSTFGGGGCELHRGGDARDFCEAGWALARTVTPSLRVGSEVFHQGADTKGGAGWNSLGLGAAGDFSKNLHLLASVNQKLGPAAGPRTSIYTALLFTF
jgi:hypothetical protein